MFKINKKKSIVNAFKRLFSLYKHKEKADIIEHNKNHNYLTIKKVKMLGFKDIQNNILIDKNNVRYKVIRLSFLSQNGLSKETEYMNHKYLIELTEKVWNKKKYIYFKEKKANLTRNIKYYEKLNETEVNPIFKQARKERIQEMRYFEKIENISLFLLLEYKDFENVLNMYGAIFKCDVLENEQLTDCLRMLVNEI